MTTGGVDPKRQPHSKKIAGYTFPCFQTILSLERKCFCIIGSHDTVQPVCVLVRLCLVSVCGPRSVFVERGLSVKPVWVDDFTVTGGDRC